MATLLDPLPVIDAAVAAVTDPGDRAQIANAVGSVGPELLLALMHGGGDAGQGELVARGIGVSPGVASGVVARSIDAALDAFDAELDVILAMEETSPADEVAMRIASAIVTSRGGTASHAAVVARDLGVPCVVGAGPLGVVDGERLMVDGATGEVRRPVVGGTGPSAPDATVDQRSTPDPSTARSGPIEDLPESVATLLAWADELATVRVLANADSADSAARSRRFGARGVGLCRVEHMFLGERAQIVERVLGGSTSAFDELAGVMTSELIGVFSAMAPWPVTVRLLDAPRHEFGGPHEHDPMMGVRGVRLALLHPELVVAQATAIAAAASQVDGADPQIMVPLVSLPGELAAVADWIAAAAPGVPIGVMVETPRSAMCADRLAGHASFISFGTNDLTQFTYGWSRDDLEATMLPAYREHGIVDVSPFETLDEGGVARLMALATEIARAARPGLTVGMCGEHGGDPRSVAMATAMGLDSVSCSAYRVPVARLAAGRAVVESSR